MVFISVSYTFWHLICFLHPVTFKCIRVNFYFIKHTHPVRCIPAGHYKFKIGSAFGHIAIGVPDVAATCVAVRSKAASLGGAITREAGPVKGGTTVIAFITDPDGYKLELIQRDGE